jgi:preprotein translocase subunit SecD
MTALATVLGLGAALAGCGSVPTASVQPPQARSPLGHGSELVFSAQTTPQTSQLNAAALSRTAVIIRQRLALAGISNAIVKPAQPARIAVWLPGGAAIGASGDPSAIAAQGGLAFYDWEANALAPDGEVVAEAMQRDRSGLAISQGIGSGPGLTGAGSLPLYRAVLLASRQRPAPFTSRLSRLGPLYYRFGAPGSEACRLAARADGFTFDPTQHCLLSGPDATKTDLNRNLPPGMPRSAGKLLVVPQGIVILQAAPSTAGSAIRTGDPAAQFYVLKDRPALSNTSITRPQVSTQPTGQPAVAFDFTQAGRAAFQTLTLAIAVRGFAVGAPSHFAIALDGHLLTVASVDPNQYPGGINGPGAAITGAFTPQYANRIASELRLGELPVHLELARGR